MDQSWRCPTCLKVRRTAYCSTCGEERLRPRDLTLSDMAARFAKGASSVDGKLLRTFRALLTDPGRLTRAYVAGQRERFVSPLALFFVSNAMFVAVQSLTGANILSTPLASHLHVQDWGPLAQSLVDARLHPRAQTVADYAPVFDEAAIFNAKALMILMVLAFVPIIALLFRGSHRSTGAHVVFALHLYSFVLALLCVAVGIADLETRLGGDGLKSSIVDLALTLFNLAACGLYIYLAIGAAYQSSGARRLVQTAALTAVVAMLFLGYRFVIFLVTLYST